VAGNAWLATPKIFILWPFVKKKKKEEEEKLSPDT